MAENKTSFILYSDLLTVIQKLVDRDRLDETNNAGELFLHILKYVNDEEPAPVNFIVDMAFEPIKLSLKRDLKKYETYIQKQSLNGKKGGRPKKATETQKTQPFIEKPKKADSVSVSVSDINIPPISPEKRVSEIKVVETDIKKLHYKDELEFLADWNSARKHYERKESNINKLTFDELTDFKQLNREFTINDFMNGIRGLFEQKDMFPANRLRPRHFLSDRNVEKYIDCHINKSQLFASKAVKL